MAEFTARIDEINQVAEASPGFIWRYTGDVDPSRLPPPWNDERLFFNMSVWLDVESFRRFVYQAPHVELIRRRSEWTEPLGDPPHVMWSIDPGETPTVPQAIAQLRAAEQGGSGRGSITL